MSDDRDDATHYQVLVNHEEQYSIWPKFPRSACGVAEIGQDRY